MRWTTCRFRKASDIYVRGDGLGIVLESDMSTTLTGWPIDAVLAQEEGEDGYEKTMWALDRNGFGAPAGRSTGQE